MTHTIAGHPTLATLREGGTRRSVVRNAATTHALEDRRRAITSTAPRRCPTSATAGDACLRVIAMKMCRSECARSTATNALNWAHFAVVKPDMPGPLAEARRTVLKRV